MHYFRKRAVNYSLGKLHSGFVCVNEQHWPETATNEEIKLKKYINMVGSAFCSPRDSISWNVYIIYVSSGQVAAVALTVPHAAGDRE